MLKRLLVKKELVASFYFSYKFNVDMIVNWVSYMRRMCSVSVSNKLTQNRQVVSNSFDKFFYNPDGQMVKILWRRSF